MTYTDQIKSMSVGETLFFPPEKLGSLSSLASSLGFVLNRRYSVTRDKERRQVAVSRVG